MKKKILNIVLFTFALFLLFTFNCSLNGENYNDSEKENEQKIGIDQDLPDSVDNSNTKYFPAIENQGAVSSCDWFAAVYYQMTYLYNKQKDRTADSSNTFSPKFGYNILNNAQIYPINIWMPDVYEFVMRHGSAVIADIPYDMAGGTGFKEWCIDEAIWQKALDYRIAGYGSISHNPDGQESANVFIDYDKYFLKVKELLSNKEVLVFQSNTNFQLIKIGNLEDDPDSTKDDAFIDQYIVTSGSNGPDHTMALVGYNDNVWVDLNNDKIVQSREKGAFKIANSFGENAPYHNAGFIWMTYETFADSIFMNSVTKMEIREDYSAKIICKLTLNHARRDQLKFQFGRSSTNDDNQMNVQEEDIFDPYGLGYLPGLKGVSLISGGNCAFDGSSGAGDGAFTFDLTDIYNGDKKRFWFLKIVNNSSAPLIIKKFQIIDLVTDTIIEDTDLPITITNEEEVRFLSFTSS